MKKLRTSNIEHPPSIINRRRHRWSPWPVALVSSFALFITAMATWIVFAVQQDMDLVRRDYYEEEIRFQQHIDRVNRTLPMRSEIVTHYDAAERTITVQLPVANKNASIVGRIHLYRPSDAALDREIPLALNAAGIQKLDAKTLVAGLWKLKLLWSVGREEFFFEEPIVIQ